MRALLPTLFILAALSAHAEVFRRLDPHGTSEMVLPSVSVSQHSECRVCHIPNKAGLGLKPGVPRLCASCHGKRPHSGAAEHLASPKITCLSCHYPHRADPLLPFTLAEPKFLLEPRDSVSLPSGVIEHRHKTPRLRKRCEDCHKW